jgi:hypothetical protein
MSGFIDAEWIIETEADCVVLKKNLVRVSVFIS